MVLVGDEVAAGSKVWVTAMWVNAKGEAGPACQPVPAWTNHATLKNAA